MPPGAAPRGGFSYHVSDEQLKAFHHLSDYERLLWVEQARLFTLLSDTGETAQRRERLRRGQNIDGT